VLRDLAPALGERGVAEVGRLVARRALSITAPARGTLVATAVRRACGGLSWSSSSGENVDWRDALRSDEERPHPAREARAPEELLARVLSRDGSKTLATDTPDVPDVRRLFTAELRAERDRLAELRAQCPPDRSRELRLAAQRADEAEQAHQQAHTDQQAASEQAAALGGNLLRRRDLHAARDRLALAEHALQTTTGQADQAAERLGLLRRAQQRHLGWMESHDEELRLQERALARELGWRGQVDQRALVLDPPGGAPAVPGRPPRPARQAAGQRLDRAGPTRAPPRGSPDPTGSWP
jgi:hypothetical protein